MTEQSMFWTDGLGDGGAYSQDQLRLLGRVVAGTFGSDAGVVPGALNKLAVTSTGNNNITIATGAAIVDGVFYSNDGVRSITTPSPSVGTTGRRVVLQKSWSTRTIRIAITTSPDGTSAIPALVQADGSSWDVPLASFTITTGGVISGLTDQRVWCSSALPPGSIIMWSGTVASIPSGFLICDGTNGTPNLLGRFVKGVATAATNPGATGGSTSHTHGNTKQADDGQDSTLDAVDASSSANHEPPYYTVAFLMKT